MIKKLKRKFILLTAISLFALLLVIVSGINIINFSSAAAESDEILSLLSMNKGGFPDEFFGAAGRPGKLPPMISPELPYEARYFSVSFNKNGDILFAETSQIAAINSTEAIEYAQKALSLNQESGFINQFRFMRSNDGDVVRVVFLNCQRQLNTLQNFLATSFLFALIGYAAVLIAVIFLAERIVRPIAESYEKQKQFITDAGHEIRTPLTIIRANVDILEMELGENESLSDISSQTNRLAMLTEDLVRLSRMEEERSYEMIEFPLSDLVYETASSFKAVAETKNKAITLDIEPMIPLKGNSHAIAQLVSILMDNALKYSNENGRIEVRLAKPSKNVILSLTNTTDTKIDKASLDRVFDRFYRADTSRSSQRGGYGIGLSMAKAIVDSHGGKINAHTADGYSFTIEVIL